MSILVDAAIWPWMDRRWAHLVSDKSHEELHAFAGRLGLRRVSFQDDHYDVDAERRDAAIALGAAAVTSRELVRRLRDAGLRRRRPGRRWTQVVKVDNVGSFGVDELLGTLSSAVPDGVLVDAAGHVSDCALSVPGASLSVAVLSRRDELAVLLVSQAADGRAPDVPFDDAKLAGLDAVHVSALGASRTVELFGRRHGTVGEEPPREGAGRSDT